MIRLQTSTIAFLAIGSALVFCSEAVTRTCAETQTQANAPTAPNVDIANPLAVHQLDRLSATGERPLFTPNRRPQTPPPASVVPPPPPVPPNVTLLGVVIDAGEARAIVQTGPANEILRVGIGDDINGWKVTQIEARQLVLSLGSRLATFTMFTDQ